MDSPPELSIVMPCLNEADTLEICIRKAQRATAEHGIESEIIIADNGSTDGSQEIAKELGARLIEVGERGYGAALAGGITESRGRFVLMGDADDSYDFLETPRFVERLREGFDLVQGCRLPAGGGRVAPGAMPFLHRWLGNPLLSALAQRMFQVPIHDIYCGMRGFTRELYDELDMRCTGMEFATEMVIKASLTKQRISEVPITLHPDGRVAHAPHLKTFRDGWRTLRFFLLNSPRWLFLVPGAGLAALGLLIYALALPGVQIFGATLDAHSLLVGSLMILIGYQSVLFAIFAKTFAINEGLLPPDPRVERFYEIFDLEKGIALSGLSFVIGAGLLLHAFNEWRFTGFGELDYAKTMRWVIPGVTISALGFQTLFSSFLTSLVGIHRK